METHYTQIDLEERCRIKAMKEQRLSHTHIARSPGRDRRTIQRELPRNSNANANGRYKPDSADRRAWVWRLRGSRIARCSRLHESMTSALAMGWTPGQINGRPQRQQGEAVISHASIYRFIYSPAGRKLKGSICPIIIQNANIEDVKGNVKSPSPTGKSLKTERKAPTNAAKEAIGRVI